MNCFKLANIHISLEVKILRGFIDKNICIGCSLCVSICSDVFKIDDDGKAVSIDDEIAKDFIDDAIEAEEQCPVIAIEIKQFIN